MKRAPSPLLPLLSAIAIILSSCGQKMGGKYPRIILIGIDGVSHRYWKYMEPEKFDVSHEYVQRYGDAIKNYYIYQDKILGELLQYSNDDTIVFRSQTLFTRPGNFSSTTMYRVTIWMPLME